MILEKGKYTYAPKRNGFSHQVDQFHIIFFNTKISEDLYFSILFMSCTNKIEIIADVVYN